MPAPDCPCAGRLAELEAALLELRAAVAPRLHAEREVVAEVVRRAAAAFGTAPWTVAALIDCGRLHPSEGRSVGRLLARFDGTIIDGLRLVCEGETREGLRWRLAGFDGLKPGSAGAGRPVACRHDEIS
jgi:hypothetical protein